jgi:metal-responsive CopG/Arc/MetJ family transcriptional regulator
VKGPNIRTSIDLPRSLHRKLHEEAARKGCSARKLILDAIEQAIDPKAKKKHRVDLTHGLVPRAGRVINPTYEQIYAEFP